MMKRVDVIKQLRSQIVSALAAVESATELEVQFASLTGSCAVAQYRFDSHSNTASVLLRADWQDVDVAHELMHMQLELVDGFSVLAWRQGVPQSTNIESAFGRVRCYVDDEVVHRRLADQDFSVDGEVLKPQLFDDIYTKVARYLKELRPRTQDGMSHLDSIGYGDLCRSSFLVQAELLRKNYGKGLPHVRAKKATRFIDAFRTHRAMEAQRADEVLALFDAHDVNTPQGHEAILRSWAKIEGLDSYVGVSRYERKVSYTLPWP